MAKRRKINIFPLPIRFQQADILPVILPDTLKKVSFSPSPSLSLPPSLALSLMSARLFWFLKIFPKAWRASFIYLSPLLFESVSWKGPFRAENQRIEVCWLCKMVLNWTGRPRRSVGSKQNFTGLCLLQMSRSNTTGHSSNFITDCFCSLGLDSRFLLMLPYVWEVTLYNNTVHRTHSFH